MDETNELLQIIYQDCDMAVINLTSLLEIIKDKDNKSKGCIENILKEYENYLKETKKHLKNNKIKPKKASMFAKMGAKMKMKSDVNKDNSDSKVSDIVIQGLVMGIIDINKRIKDYDKDVNKDIITFANSLIEFQQRSVDSLKEYL